MLEILNTLMMCVGYVVTVVAILVSLLFIETPKESNADTRFAWLPTYVAIWNKNYNEHKFVWLRYYFVTSAEPEYIGLDGSTAPKSLSYVVSAERRTFLM